MMLALLEIPPEPGKMFPRIGIYIGGKLYLVGRVDAAKFGYQLMDAPRNAVGRVDLDTPRGVIAAVDVHPVSDRPLPQGEDRDPAD